MERDKFHKELETVPNKSSFIAEALKEKMEREKKKKIDELLIEGYKATKEEDKKLNKEWEEITLEGWT